MTSRTKHKFGFVSLIGPPNVGKSSFINRAVGQKVSIVTRKPQTTRHRILGIKTCDTSQIVFVDTPGIHDNEKKTLNRVINKTAISSIADVDLVVFIIDQKGWNKHLIKIFSYIKSQNTKTILLINKIDKLTDKTKLLPIIDEARSIHDFIDIIPVSILKKSDVGKVVEAIEHALPIGEAGFPENQITDRGDKFIATEMIREQSLLKLGQELPYVSAIEITSFTTDEKEILRIEALIWVEKASQKRIVIGKNGAQIKSIGQGARIQLEKTFSKKVYLSLWVKVKENWADNQHLLHALGYKEF